MNNNNSYNNDNVNNGNLMMITIMIVVIITTIMVNIGLLIITIMMIIVVLIMMITLMIMIVIVIIIILYTGLFYNTVDILHPKGSLLRYNSLSPAIFFCEVLAYHAFLSPSIHCSLGFPFLLMLLEFQCSIIMLV